MKTLNLASPKNIKGSYNETHDLMAKEYYWLAFKKCPTFEEMKIWHHAFMELYFSNIEGKKRAIDKDEAEEWFMRGLSYFDIQANDDIQRSRGIRSETKLKSLERTGESLAYSEKDEQILETAKIKHITKNVVFDAIREKTTKQAEPCRVYKEIFFNFRGQRYKSRIEI